MNEGRRRDLNGDYRMTIEGLNSALEERGVVWQGSGFALVGAVSLSLLWVYSEADHWSIGIYRFAVTELNWAFVIALALVIEGIRKMFETRTAIRRAARERAIAKAFAQGAKHGEQRATERFKAALHEPGVELPPELKQKLLENAGGRKWWHRFRFFRSE